MASAIVSSRSARLEVITSTEDCVILSPEFCTQAARISFFTLDPTSQTLLLNLDGVEEELEIPAELVDLVARTRNSIEQMQPALTRFLDEAQCNTTASGHASATRFTGSSRSISATCRASSRAGSRTSNPHALSVA